MSKDSVAQKKVRPLNKVWATPREKKRKEVKVIFYLILKSNIKKKKKAAISEM